MDEHDQITRERLLAVCREKREDAREAVAHAEVAIERSKAILRRTIESRLPREMPEPSSE